MSEEPVCFRRIGQGTGGSPVPEEPNGSSGTRKPGENTSGRGEVPGQWPKGSLSELRMWQTAMYRTVMSRSWGRKRLPANTGQGTIHVR